MSRAGTRKSDLRKMRQRKKPKPLWMQYASRFGAPATLGLVLVAAPYWLISSGWVGRTIESAVHSFYTNTASAGLAVNDIFLTGRNQTPPADVLMALDVKKGQPMLALDINAARSEIETLPWVKTARIERRFPGTLLVSLVEREPIGILQKDGVQSLVDETGTVLATGGQLGRWANLPVLVGEGSPQALPPLLWALADYPDLYRRVKALTYLSQRRWDILLDNAVVIHMPEGDAKPALERLNKAQKEQHLLDRAVKSIDLRFQDRMIIEPTADATATRNKTPKQGI